MGWGLSILIFQEGNSRIDNIMKSCHLLSAALCQAPCLTLFLQGCYDDYDNVGKRTVLPNSQMGKLRCREDRLTCPKASGRVNGMQTSLSGSKSLFPLAKGCFRLKSAEDPLWPNFTSLENNSDRRGNGWLEGKGEEWLAGGIFPPCGERKGGSHESNWMISSQHW